MLVRSLPYRPFLCLTSMASSDVELTKQSKAVTRCYVTSDWQCWVGHIPIHENSIEMAPPCRFG